MRIAFFVDSFPVLSETFILNQITGLIDEGHDIRIFAASRPREKLTHTSVRNYRLLEKTVYINDKPSNYLLRLVAGTALFTKHAPLNPKLMRNTINVLKYGKESLTLTLLFQTAALLNEGYFDIFYCHYGHNGELALRLKQLGFRAKIITMFHGYDLRRGIADNGQCYKNLLNHGDAFLSISEHTTRVLTQWGVDLAKIIYHPIGVDIEECGLHSQDRSVWRTIRVITVARLVPEKNISLAIEVIRRVVHEYGLKNFSYRIIGDGPLLADLKIQAKGLENIVSFGGAMTHNAVLEELNNADIFLLTSNEEILPTSLMEAQACGLPVIATDAGDVRAIIKNDISGFVVPKSDLGSITEKLVYLLTHSPVRRQLGEKGRTHVQNCFDIHKLNSRLIEIFQSVRKGIPATSITESDPAGREEGPPLKHAQRVGPVTKNVANITLVYPGLFISSLLIGVVTALITAFYNLWGEKIITDIYFQRAHYLVNSLITGRASNQLSEYLEIARQFIFDLNGMGYAAALAFMIGAFKNNNYMRYLFYSVLFGFAVAFYSQSSAFLNDFIINDDARQHIWWMRKFIDPKLFPNDLLTQYAISLQHIGIMGIYRLAAFVMDPLFFSKLLPLLLFPLSSMFIYLSAEEEGIKPEFSFLISTAFCVTPYFLMHTTGGHAHTFGFTLLTAFVYYYLKQQFRVCAFLMLLQSLFFPIILLLSVGLYGSSVLLCQKNVWFLDNRKGKWVPFFFALTACLAILSIKFILLKNPDIGKPFSRPQVVNMVELTAEGRWEVAPIKPAWKEILTFSRQSLFVFPMLQKSILPSLVKRLLIGHGVLLAALFILFVLTSRKRFSPLTDVFIRLGIVSLLLYITAAELVLQMYAPDRYFEYSVPLIAFFIFIIPVSYILQNIPVQNLRRFLFIVILSLTVMNIPLTKDLTLVDLSKDAPLFRLLQQLPVDSLIAAPPDLADNIPVFAKRRVFLNWELSVPLYDKYWQTIKTRTYDFFRAYYTTDPLTLSRFCLKYRIDFLVVRKSDFSEEKLASQDIYFEPFNKYILTELIGKNREFVLPNLSSRYKIFENNDIIIINARQLAILKCDE